MRFENSKKCVMNYEELLAAKNEGKGNKIQQPIGCYYREQVEGKWCGVVDIRPDLNDNIVFVKALRNECEQNKNLTNHHQLHFTPVKEGNEVKRLELEKGNYQTFEQLLIENPAVVASKNFIENTLEALVEVTAYLHEQHIMHICYSPRTVFARKGDNAVLLLNHGSFYQELNDQQSFYGDDACYVAPEVLNHGTIDERCDVYSIGKFMQSLCDQADLPLEYRAAIKKAVSEKPEDRFSTPEDMLKAIQKRRSMFKSALGVILGIVAALVCLGLYFDMTPESTPVEFVKPAPRQATDELIDDGFDPSELGVAADGDSLVVDEEAVKAAERDYQAKAEEIFRKKYEKEADRILSKIYNKDYMTTNEKKFLAESEATIDELMKVQSQLGSDAGLTPERAQVIASEIIERVSEQKKKSVGAGSHQNGIKK